MFKISFIRLAYIIISVKKKNRGRIEKRPLSDNFLNSLVKMNIPKGYFYVLEVKSNVFFIIKIKDENH